MRNKFKALVSVVAVAGAFASAPAHAFLENWYLAYDGVTKTQISEYLDVVGPSVVTTTAPVAGNFSFSEFGAIKVAGHDGGATFGGSSTAQISAILSTTGVAALGGSIVYTGGSIDVWANPTATFATSAGTYGVNPAGSIKIATFSPVLGGGLIDPTGIPNGLQTISAKATFLLAGYFFAPDGITDLSTLVPGGVVFGFATTNASFVKNPTALVVSELGGGTITGCLPGQLTGGCTGTGDFAISNNGQFRLAVPEPGSLALLGLAVAGMSFFGRRKTQS